MRVLHFFSSSAVNTAIGVLGLLVPFGAYISHDKLVEHILLGSAVVIIVSLVIRADLNRRVYLQVSRAQATAMADPGFFSFIRQKIEGRLIDQLDDLADGHVHMYSSEVPRMSALLFQALTQADSTSQQVLATDLTVDPRILLTRLEYLAANRRFMQAGGSIKRIFIVQAQSLTRKIFAQNLLALVDQHRSEGVLCGIAVREHLTADQAVDFVVFGNGAVLVEEEQGNAEYTTGRSSIYFRRVAIWQGRFQSIWEGSRFGNSQTILLHYENIVRQMLAADQWNTRELRSIFRIS